MNVKLDCDKGKLTVDDVTVDVPSGEELYPVFILWRDSACTLFH